MANANSGAKPFPWKRYEYTGKTCESPTKDMRRTVRPKLVSLHDGIIDLAENSGHYYDESLSKLSANDHPIKSSDSKQKIGNPMKQVLCEAATQKGKCIRPEFAHILRTCHDMRHFVRLYIDG